MGVLDDMLDATGGDPRPARTFGDVVARAVGSRSAQARSEAEAPSLDPLLALDDSQLRRLIRYLPAEAVVPLLARASVPVAQRLVGLLDAESQAWLAAQSDAIEACSVAAHAAAARRALDLIPRAVAAPPLPAEAEPPARRPVQVGMSFSSAPVEAAPAAPPSPPPVATAPDDTIGTLADLVALAAGLAPGRLGELAASVDHPVLAAGLSAIAAGADTHAVDETARAAGHDWIEQQTRHVELMRLALLSIRFGAGPDHFRSQAAKV